MTARMLSFRTPPMLATLHDEPFHRAGWIYEEKYDGIRILAFKKGKRVRLMTRNAIDRGPRFERVVAAVAALPAPALVLDGEIVAVDASGVSRFQLLQRGGEPRFVVFDCLFASGADLRPRPLSDRRRMLQGVLRRGPALRMARRLARNGIEAYAVARGRGLEGIIAKNARSSYVSARSRDWLKIKIRQEDEFVIGGYTSPSGTREHLGALLLGAYDAKRRFVYVGRVGTGFTGAVLQDLARRLRPWVRARAPFADPPHAAGVTWVAPRLVAQIAFHEWTRDGRLRQPAYLGLRSDKAARDVRVPEARS